MREPEAAEYLGLTVRTLRNYRRRGKLSFKEVTGKTRPVIEYDQAELDRLKADFDQRRTTAAKPKRGRPNPNKRVTFGLPPEGYAELEKNAERVGVSVSDYARRVVREGLESRYQQEAAELRSEVKRLSREIEQIRKDFAAGFESVLEFTGVEPAEAKKWVTENLR
jgi:hypothetical protein